MLRGCARAHVVCAHAHVISSNIVSQFIPYHVTSHIILPRFRTCPIIFHHYTSFSILTNPLVSPLSLSVTFCHSLRSPVGGQFPINSLHMQCAREDLSWSRTQHSGSRDVLFNTRRTKQLPVSFQQFSMSPPNILLFTCVHIRACDSDKLRAKLCSTESWMCLSSDSSCSVWVRK